MSERFIKAICYKEALFAWTTFLQISQMQSTGTITVIIVQTCWDHVSWTIPHFFSQLWTEAYTKYQRLVKRLYLLQSVSIKTEEYITLTGSKYIICSLMFFLFLKKTKPLQSLMFKQRHRKNQCIHCPKLFTAKIRETAYIVLDLPQAYIKSNYISKNILFVFYISTIHTQVSFFLFCWFSFLSNFFSVNQMRQSAAVK